MPRSGAPLWPAYVALCEEALAQGAKIFFVDEAYFRADADLRAKWVLRGERALVDSTSPRLGEKAIYYSAVCLETGEVEVMYVTGNTTAETSVAFLTQLRDKHPEPLIVIWDNGPAHHGPALREYLTTPDLKLRLVALPAYSPDFNPDEAIWDWVRAEVTANTCFGTAATVREKVDAFFSGLAERARRSSSAAAGNCRPRPMHSSPRPDWLLHEATTTFSPCDQFSSQSLVPNP